MEYNVLKNGRSSSNCYHRWSDVVRVIVVDRPCVLPTSGDCPPLPPPSQRAGYNCRPAMFLPIPIRPLHVCIHPRVSTGVLTYIGIGQARATVVVAACSHAFNHVISQCPRQIPRFDSTPVECAMGQSDGLSPPSLIVV